MLAKVLSTGTGGRTTGQRPHGDIVLFIGYGSETTALKPVLLHFPAFLQVVGNPDGFRSQAL